MAAAVRRGEPPPARSGHYGRFPFACRQLPRGPCRSPRHLDAPSGCSPSAWSASGSWPRRPGSPYPAVLPQGQEPGGPFRWVSDLLFLRHLGQVGLVFIGTAALVTAAAGFLMILREAWQGRLPMRTAVLLAVIANLAVLTLPLLFSRDVYSYAFYGRIFNSYGASPYSATPADFHLNGMFDVTWPGWRDTPSVYGPLFTWFSIALTAIDEEQAVGDERLPVRGRRRRDRHDGDRRADGPAGASRSRRLRGRARRREPRGRSCTSSGAGTTTRSSRCSSRRPPGTSSSDASSRRRSASAWRCRSRRAPSSRS